ncbi:hypothetical protein CcrJ4_gp465 [Caulobacter phage J4]|nr:hypothetical protein CcrJ4_gp465 [Caulobacter phage J4]UTU09775.1 hypothetical protein CcrBL47_gp491 [Caulobacter phage BL47]UTU10329.1 hypothetical protein CcrRB23_gp467 [Caulobacter phage RB23]
MKKTHKITADEAAIIRKAATKLVGNARVRLELNLHANDADQEGYNTLALGEEHSTVDTCDWGQFRNRVFPLVDGAARLDISIYTVRSKDGDFEVLNYIYPIWEGGKLVRIEGLSRIGAGYAPIWGL